MDDLVKEFLVEAYEGLDKVDRDLLALEQDPTARDLLDNILRIMHSIKGTCGFLGFSKLESVTHVAENLLTKLRAGDATLNSEIADVLLRTVDAVRAMLTCIEETHAESEEDYSDLVAVITRLYEQETDEEDSQETKAAPEATPETSAMDSPLSAEPKKQEAPTKTVGDASIRVDVELLDTLMTLVGELVLTRNQILQYTSTQGNPILLNASQRLSHITTELQEGVMKTRMQPIGNVWSKFPRIVRDLSATCGKSVKVEMEGKETELDKTLLEAIKDPLTHIIRNSVDHGIESPEERILDGKPEEGTLALRAYHEGGMVNVEIEDNGGGINAARVKEKAIEKEILTEDQAAKMSKKELISLIFAPGFSTAAAVTNISGRGVGMDVVRTNIENIGGSIDVQSTLGEGTTMRLKIPLTLAIIPALTVTNGAERFAIPQVNLLELVRLEGEKRNAAVEYVHNSPVYRLRGTLLPLVYLKEILGETLTSENERESLNIVVLQTDECRFGLVVDAVHDSQEIVVKPLREQLKEIAVFSGSTIMGDGTVALILDIPGIAAKANIDRASQALQPSESVSRERSENDTGPFLICSAGADRRVAVPLSSVTRLEKLPRDSVQRTSTYDVIHYRDSTMPLVYLSDIVPGNTSSGTAESDHLPVIVYRRDDHTFGMVVDGITDIVEDDIQIEKVSSKGGITGQAIIGEKVTEFLDVPTILKEFEHVYGS